MKIKTYNFIYLNWTSTNGILDEGSYTDIYGVISIGQTNWMRYPHTFKGQTQTFDVWKFESNVGRKFYYNLSPVSG